MRPINSLPILLCTLLLASDCNVVAFTSATRIRKIVTVVSKNDIFCNNKPPRIPSSNLYVATIDGSFIFDAGDESFGCIKSVTRGSSSGGGPQTGPTFATNLAAKKIFSNNILVTTVVAMLSIWATLKAESIGAPLRFFRSLSAWYLKRLQVAPLLTKCLTGGLISFAGDYGAQWFEFKASRKASRNGPSDRASRLVASSPRAGGNTMMTNPLSIQGTYNLRRGVARLLECILISSPIMHYGYDFFESIIPVVGGTGLYASFAALSHVLADSVFLDGLFVGTGIVATGVMEGHSLRKHVIPNLKNVYVPTLKASMITSWALMPLQFLSFRFLPVQLRVLSVNAVDLIWTGVISFVSHSAEAHT